MKNPSPAGTDFRFLLFGHDTVECAYYLRPLHGCLLDFRQLAVEKEALRQAKSKDPKVVSLGGVDFFLYAHGTNRGYPFLIKNEGFTIEFGEFNDPSFFVTFRSLALWREGAFKLHQRFMDWAAALRLAPYRLESLSRVDFTFDYHLPVMDFTEDSLVSLFANDSKYRKDSKTRGFQFGSGIPLLLRIYDKVREIEEKSQKTWFYELWGIDQDVWRIEWQVRKDLLRKFHIHTFDILALAQGDLLRDLVNDHSTLRIPTDDSNRSRWPVHPLWADLQCQVENFERAGIGREIDGAAFLNERLIRVAVSVYGYLKRIGAVHCVQRGKETASVTEALNRLQLLIDRVHDPLTWEGDVQKRVDEIRLGQW